MILNTIINCKFEYKCDLDWDLLNETQDPKIRFCNQCKKEVKLCLSNNEIDRAWETGTCVAHPIYSPELVEKIKKYEAGLGPYPFKAIEMPLGLPKRRN
jgi:hypothetical protein